MTHFASATLFDFDGATGLASLAAASNLQWLDPLDEPGSFSFSIPVEDVPAIAIGQIVKIAFGPTSASWVFAGVIETLELQQLGSGTDGVAREWNVSGRGVRALLEDALVYNSGASAVRSFTSATAGAIMKTLIDEAQARNALSALTYDFTNSLDSDGNAYAETLTIDEQVGTTLLAVADRHQELAVDYWIDPDLVLHYVNARGIDRTTGVNPLVLRIGQSVGELADRVSGPVRNHVLIATGDGSTFSTQQDAGSISTYGRREAFLSLTSNSDASVVSLATAHLLGQQALPADGSTIQLSDNGPIPYVDFEVGDTVYLARLDGSRTAYRIRSISCQVDDSGAVVFIPELGTTRPDLTRRLNIALQRLEKQGASESQLAADIGGGLGGGAEIYNGEVLTYNATTETGTVDVDGNTINFSNGTGFGLGVGDTVVLTEIMGVTDPVAVGIFDRAGSYTPIVINNPQAVTGFPFDGDQLPNQFNYPFDAGGGLYPYSTGTYSAGPAAWYGSGVLGYSGRVLVFLSRTSTTAQVPIVIYDVETGSSTALNRTPSVGATNRSHSVGVIGTRLFITYDGATGNCVESWDSTTGTWTSHAIPAAVYLGVSDNRAWWLGVATTGSPPRWQVYSIDGSGTLSNTQAFGTFYRNGTVTGTDTTPQVFGRAKNGKIYFSFNVTAADTLYVADTNVAAASLTFTSTTAPSTLPWSGTNTAGTQALRDANRSYVCSDIDANGWLYFFVRTGTPTTAGFAKVNPTTLAVTTYTQLTSSTGNPSNGEIVLNCGLALAGSEVVLFGAVREDVVTAGGRTTSVVPAYWRTDGVTTNRTHDAEYIGLTGGNGTDFGAGRTCVIHRDSVSSTFFFHTNIANEGRFSFNATDAKTAGPAYGEALTV